MVPRTVIVMSVNHGWETCPWTIDRRSDDSSHFWRANLPGSDMSRTEQRRMLHWPFPMQMQLCGGSNPVWIPAAASMSTGSFRQVSKI
ncbi:hypothetical protein MRX96_011065 [Rhipicephalus microplus]